MGSDFGDSLGGVTLPYVPISLSLVPFVQNIVPFDTLETCVRAVRTILACEHAFCVLVVLSR